jgi:phosphoribosylanthranilate isomerase
MKVKICGVRTRADAVAAAEAGADYIGLVFLDRSPRALTIGDARWIVGGVTPRIKRVALMVDAGDDLLGAVLQAVPIDMIQLHGGETPERVRDVRARFGLPVMKAIGVRGPDDVDALGAFERVADQLLVDARAPADADRPGGHGLPFDWQLIAGRRWRVPWMLAGGLRVETVAEAVRVTGARQVDVSSGVETSPGEKDPDLIAAFVAAAHSGERVTAPGPPRRWMERHDG